ncbi:hypothetical protein FOA52_016010 [Chlamydomonas sp. UWO 241]|nr:hypothetical protein FOA52_016010 [Chlamydomonas sp. UWO 241]
MPGKSAQATKAGPPPAKSMKGKASSRLAPVGAAMKKSTASRAAPPAAGASTRSTASSRAAGGARRKNKARAPTPGPTPELPPALLAQIFSRLHAKDVGCAASVSSSWRGAESREAVAWTLAMTDLDPFCALGGAGGCWLRAASVLTQGMRMRAGEMRPCQCASHYCVATASVLCCCDPSAGTSGVERRCSKHCAGSATCVKLVRDVRENVCERGGPLYNRWTIDPLREHKRLSGKLTDACSHKLQDAIPRHTTARTLRVAVAHGDTVDVLAKHNIFDYEAIENPEDVPDFECHCFQEAHCHCADHPVLVCGCEYQGQCGCACECDINDSDADDDDDDEDEDEDDDDDDEGRGRRRCHCEWDYSCRGDSGNPRHPDNGGVNQASDDECECVEEWERRCNAEDDVEVEEYADTVVQPWREDWPCQAERK